MNDPLSRPEREWAARSHLARTDAQRTAALEAALLAIADELADETRNGSAVQLLLDHYRRPTPSVALVSTSVRQQIAAAAADIQRRRAS